MYVLCVERGSSSNHEGGTERKAVKYYCVYLFVLGHSLIRGKSVVFFKRKIGEIAGKAARSYMKFAKYREACRQSARHKVELPPAKMVVKGGASSGYCFYLQDKFSHQKTWTQ